LAKENRNTHHSSSQSQGVVHPVLGDFAGQMDTRHPLHHKPLPHRGGADGRTVLYHRGLGGLQSPAVFHDLPVDGDQMSSDGPEYFGS
jgi:hypothetical protein